MTDRDLFEAQLQARLLAYVAPAARPFDAEAVARRAAALGAGRGLLGRLTRRGDASLGSRDVPRRLPWRSVATAVLAALLVLVVVGAGLFIGSQLATTVPVPMLETETVEPMVERVLSDGAGHEITTMDVAQLSIGPDGVTWVWLPDAVFELGQQGSHSTPPGYLGGLRLRNGDTAVAPDGTLWVAGGSGLEAFDGNAWTRHAPVPGEAWDLAFQPDGTVWATWGGAIGRLDSQGWRTWSYEDVPGFSPEGGMSTVTVGQVAITPDGDVWVGMVPWAGAGGGGVGLIHLVGDGWELVDPVGDGVSRGVNELAAGLDGTVWAHLGPVGDPHGYLARLDGESWTALGGADGVPMLGAYGNIRGQLAVAPDGTLWLNPQIHGIDAEGVMAFDGSTWTSYGRGRFGGNMDLDIGPDGTVWIAHDGSLYVVRPTDDTAGTPMTGDGAAVLQASPIE